MIHGSPTKMGDVTGRCRSRLSGRQLGGRRPHVQKAGEPAVAFDEPGLGQIIRTVDIGHQRAAIIDRQAASPEMLAALERIGPRLAGWVRYHGELVHGHRAAPSVSGSPGNDVSYVRFPPSALGARRTPPDVRTGEPLSARDFPRRWRRDSQPMAKWLAPTTVRS